MIYIKNYINTNINKFNYVNILDRNTNNLYISVIKTTPFNINSILILNKFIFKYKTSPIFFYYSIKKFLIFVKTFISKFYNIVNFMSKIYNIDIQILNIFYKVILIHNKLIIKINNFNNVIIYISSKNVIKCYIDYSNHTLISLSSYNKEFLTNLSSIIVNSAKFNVYTNTGIKYLNQNIKLKKQIKLSKK